MKYFIFISPNFPDHYFQFIKELKNAGFNVLGIGDCSYDELNPSLKENLFEYYKCDDMDNFDNEVKAVEYFVNKYGHIDYLESNNEYWLKKDGKLRTIFNIDGFKEDEIDRLQHKSKMKKYFNDAGVKTAKYVIYENEAQLRLFIEEVGYPIFIKPDTGVGSEESYKINSESDLINFINHHSNNVSYIVEQFIQGVIVSYDGLTDSNGHIVFNCNNVFPPSITDVLKEQNDLFYYTYKDLIPSFKVIGPKVIKTFNIKQRFFHIEFFVVTKDIPGFVEAGDVVGLEANLRPAGGYTTDMWNFSNSIDCYKLYADVMAKNHINIEPYEHYFCACASRRNDKEYLYSDTELLAKWPICFTKKYPKVFSGIMGDRCFMCKFTNLEEVKLFESYCNQLKNAPIIDNFHRIKNKNMTGEDIDMFNDQKYDSSKKESICDLHIDGA